MTETRMDRFELPEGTVILYWQAPLSAVSMAEMLDWFDLMRRKISRNVEQVTMAATSEATHEPAAEHTEKVSV